MTDKLTMAAKEKNPKCFHGVSLTKAEKLSLLNDVLISPPWTETTVLLWQPNYGCVLTVAFNLSTKSVFTQ